MIPAAHTALNGNIEIRTQPSKNHRMHLEAEVINGFCDGLQAMRQVIFKILMTERYQYVIYSWNYGIELKDLMGKPVSYVCPEIERRITEALTQDDRIRGVHSFTFDTSKKNEVRTTFEADTIFGSVTGERAVMY